MSRSFSFLVWFGLVIVASLALYHVSDRTQTLNQELRQLNAAIDTERQSLHVIKADYVYLANPERIEKTAKRFLPLRPSDPQQVAALNDIADVLPTHGETMTKVALNDVPRSKSQSDGAEHPKTSTKTKVKVAALRQPPQNPTRTLASATPQPKPQLMQRTASAAPLPDSIGALINELGSHP